MRTIAILLRSIVGPVVGAGLVGCPPSSDSGPFSADPRPATEAEVRTVLVRGDFWKDREIAEFFGADGTWASTGEIIPMQGTYTVKGDVFCTVWGPSTLQCRRMVITSQGPVIRRQDERRRYRRAHQHTLTPELDTHRSVTH